MGLAVPIEAREGAGSAPRLGVPGVAGRIEPGVEEPDVATVQVALEALGVVALGPPLGDVPLLRREQRPLQRGQGGGS